MTNLQNNQSIETRVSILIKLPDFVSNPIKKVESDDTALQDTLQTYLDSLAGQELKVYYFSKVF
ncbi:MAG: hypothetical protein JWO40_805 [Candidatus Doudnabacteria bacterium]|nr:hypothetical protein [Candidatus Doudnabacteria bacterium]